MYNLWGFEFYKLLRLREMKCLLCTDTATGNTMESVEAHPSAGTEFEVNVLKCLKIWGEYECFAPGFMETELRKTKIQFSLKQTTFASIRFSP